MAGAVGASGARRDCAMAPTEERRRATERTYGRSAVIIATRWRREISERQRQQSWPSKGESEKVVAIFLGGIFVQVQNRGK